MKFIENKKYLGIRKTFDNKLEVVECSIKKVVHGETRKFGRVFETKYKTERGALKSLETWNYTFKWKKYSLICGIMEYNEFQGEVYEL